MCVLCTPRPIYRSSVGRCSIDMSTRRPTLGRYIDRDVTVDILTEKSTEMSVDISTDTRPIFRSICRPRAVVQHSDDMSLDRLPTFPKSPSLYRMSGQQTCPLYIIPPIPHCSLRTKPSQNSIETQSSLKPNQPDCHWRLNAQLKSKFQPPSPPPL